MRTAERIYRGKSLPEIKGLELLSIHEMFTIRGGGNDEKIKTKEIDVYDIRED